MLSTKYLPRPGILKIFSTTKEPVSIAAARGPMYVTIGIIAFLKACLNIIILLD